MKNSADSFFGAARSVRLSPGEKDGILANIRNAVRKSPGTRHHFGMDERGFLEAAKTIALTPRERVTIKEFLMQMMHAGNRHHRWLDPFKSFASITASLLIVSIAGASVSYAAERAMPGDMLYPVKMHVNEKFESSIAVTPKARAAVAAKHAERRLKEAEMLAAKSALDPANQKMLASEVKRNVSAVQTEVNSLMSQHDMAGAGSIGMNLEAALGAHTRLLARIAERHGVAMDDLMDALHEGRMNIEESTIAANREPSNGTEITAAAVIGAIASAEEQIGRASATVRPDGSGCANASLSKAREALAATDPTLGLGDAKRLRLARTALRRAKEAVILASMPHGPKPASARVPTTALPKANITTEAVSTDHGDRSDADDVHFDAAVRMRMTEEELQHVREALDHRKNGMADGKSQQVETRISGSEQLMNMARIQMNRGNMNEALDASDAALKHAETATRELKMIMSDTDD